ncbi:PqqD family protein [Tepidimicrobium xylanilyticum]|uniref:Coenzyme PQQ synthesis protein D (PqqD) n=1 Tax=Tepidimicrobium xylanilyticum TaxID=1123352 RepID=A0A1H2WB07_9FIRM|nr:PqqD family protein [Tepidimicrobium xylanilyticum]SDW77873.1 Coenzyme PQQ synthesis protein D (PqqD) [Tepidimicrobium xylanilyticum]
MFKRNKKEENYLDYIPKKSEKIHWIEKEDGLIQIIIYRNSLFERIVRKLFFTPDKYRIDLDQMGSFIWKHIDGEKSVYQISQLVKGEFQEKAEPLYERLIQFMNILKNNKFIDFK